MVRQIVSLSLVVSMSVLMTAQERDRSKIDPKYTWNLTEVYQSEAAWRQEKERIAAQLPKLRVFQGTLGSSPQALADALELSSSLEKELSRLYVYASMLADQDTGGSTHQGMQQEMQQLAAVRQQHVPRVYLFLGAARRIRGDSDAVADANRAFVDTHPLQHRQRARFDLPDDAVGAQAEVRMRIAPQHLRDLALELDERLRLEAAEEAVMRGRGARESCED